MTVVRQDMQLSELTYQIRRDLCRRLRVDAAWRTVAQYLSDAGFTIDVEGMDALADRQEPSDRLLECMAEKHCDVEALCIILEECELFYALSVLKDPEPVEIITEPGEGRQSCSVQYYGTLRLECHARSLPPPLYQWWRDNTMIPGATSSELSIPDFGPELTGLYCCKVRADYSGSPEVSSREVDVRVSPILPEIVEQPQGVNRLEGETVCLKCTTDPFVYPSPTFQWYRGNEELKNQEKCILYINYAKASDSGLYRCKVTNKAGEVESECVSVMVEPRQGRFLPPLKRNIAKQKVALLIGNEKYEHHDNLKKPVDDIELLAKKLREINFVVVCLINLRLVEMRNALHQFSQLLAPGVYSLFYYVGHGIQDDERLILPVDAPKLYNYEDCLSVNEIKDKMLCNNPATRVILLDMCLQRPDRTFVERPIQAPKEVSRKPDINLLLVFSTSGNLSAYESPSESNGTYIKFFSKFIKEDILMVDVIQKTHDAIYSEMERYRKVENKQIPMWQNNLYEKYCFTDEVSGNVEIDRVFNSVYEPPRSEVLNFQPSINFNPSPAVRFFRHRDCILNALDIEIRGIDLDSWSVEVCSQKEILQMGEGPIKHISESDYLRVIVEDLQGAAVAGALNLTINLKNRDNKLVDSVPLFLAKPLILKWFS